MGLLGIVCFGIWRIEGVCSAPTIEFLEFFCEKLDFLLKEIDEEDDPKTSFFEDKNLVFGLLQVGVVVVEVAIFVVDF